ncbi:MAG: hypothetical protein OEX07_14760 [Gammaproteobacteria bacterium]|nr:hypothetical protein [Gammaproteobacteria bacterium]
MSDSGIRRLFSMFNIIIKNNLLEASRLVIEVMLLEHCEFHRGDNINSEGGVIGSNSNISSDDFIY